jgi:hypothetical protein
MARKPFKKDLTPLRKGGQVTTHTGKGATEQRRGAGGSEFLTGGDPYRSAANQYPKSQPEPEAPEPEEPPVPMGQAPSRMPTAMMPPSGDDDEAA